MLDPPGVTVTVKGPKAVLDELKDTDIHTYVELANHAGNTANYRVEVHVPAGVTVPVMRASGSSCRSPVAAPLVVTETALDTLPKPAR